MTLGLASLSGRFTTRVKAVEIPNPKWLVIPERGTIHRSGNLRSRRVRQDLSLHAPIRTANLVLAAKEKPQLRAAALVLEVKGDFCHDIRKSWPMPDGKMTTSSWAWMAAGSGIRSPQKCSIPTRWPTPFLPCSISYSARARSRSGNRLTTNLVRWIIELHRVLPDQWVTLRQVYHCAIDKELFEAKIKAAEAFVRQRQEGTILYPAQITAPTWTCSSRINGLLIYRREPIRNSTLRRWNPSSIISISNTKLSGGESTVGEEIRQRVEAVNRWYQHDWGMIDNKIVEHSGGNIRFPFHIRPAGRGQSVLSAKAPGASPSSASPRRPRRPPQVHPSWTWDESASELATPR